MMAYKDEGINESNYKYKESNFRHVLLRGIFGANNYQLKFQTIKLYEKKSDTICGKVFDEKGEQIFHCLDC